MFDSKGGFPSYEEIFAQRADAYQLAMESCPRARDREFQLAVEEAGIQRGATVCDAPAGGGYLRAYLPVETGRYLAVETAPDFIGHCPMGQNDRVVESPLHAIGIEDASVDVVISMAGVHHLPDKRRFYSEAARILRPGGRLVLADAEEGSRVDRFLNQFVDRYNSMGHTGEFLTASTAKAIGACDFRVQTNELRRYPWSFDSRSEMGRYCKLLFGMDRADEDTVSDGIEEILGLMPGRGRVNLAWSLRFIVADRN